MPIHASSRKKVTWMRISLPKRRAIGKDQDMGALS
jgi:hypothetical protein